MLTWSNDSSARGMTVCALASALAMLLAGVATASMARVFHGDGAAATVSGRG